MAEVTGGLFDHVNEHPAQGDFATQIPGSIVTLQKRCAHASLVVRRRVCGKLAVERVGNGEAELTVGIFFAVPERYSRFAASASLRPRTFMNTVDRWYSRKLSRISRSDPWCGGSVRVTCAAPSILDSPCSWPPG